MPLRRLSRRRGRRAERRADTPQLLSSRADVQDRVNEHKAAYGCPGDASLSDEACPCGSRVLVICGSCGNAVLMMVAKRPCHHEFVYRLDDGTTLRPFEGY